MTYEERWAREIEERIKALTHAAEVVGRELRESYHRGRLQGLSESVGVAEKLGRTDVADEIRALNTSDRDGRG